MQIPESEKNKDFAATKNVFEGEFRKPSPRDDSENQFAIAIAAPRETAYSFFRNFQNLSAFMAGDSGDWHSEILREKAGEMISWKSVSGSESQTSGSIWFSPATDGRGTIVNVIFESPCRDSKLRNAFRLMLGEDPKTLADRIFSCLNASRIF